jgi:hypothetical protein
LSNYLNYGIFTENFKDQKWFLSFLDLPHQDTWENI